MRKLFALALSVVMLSLAITGCNENKKASTTKIMMDTVVTITVDGAPNAAELVQGAIDICDKYSLMFDRHNKNSYISKINSAQGSPVEVPSEVIELIDLSLKYYEYSGGLFDITVAPILDMWDFSGESTSLPINSKVVEELENVGSDKIVLTDTTVALKRGMSIDLGAVAKGYIADKVYKYLSDNGAENAVINLGGNVYVLNGQGKSSKVGIQKPFDNNGTLAATVEISNMTAVTSGVYQRYFYKDDKLYHHIINPKTGYPVDTDIYSVTVIGKSSAEADALSTTLLSLGYESSQYYIASMEDFEAIFILSDGTVVTSAGIYSEDGVYKIK